jgi:hypothetical protein
MIPVRKIPPALLAVIIHVPTAMWLIEWTDAPHRSEWLFYAIIFVPLLFWWWGVGQVIRGFWWLLERDRD